MDANKVTEARKYRIYPTPKQEEQIIFNINANREVWNHMLAFCYKPVQDLEVIKNLPDSKRTKGIYEYINGYINLKDNQTNKSQKIYSYKKLKSIIKKERFDELNYFKESNNFSFNNFTIEKHGLVYEEQRDLSKRLRDITPKLVQQEYPRLKYGDSASYDYIKREALKRAFDTHFNPSYKNAAMPKFRSYKETQYLGSYSTKAGSHSFVRPNGDLKLSGFRKLGDIKMINHYPINGRLFKVTITRTSTNKYYASLFYECEKHTRQYGKTNNEVGIDLNTIKHGFVTNNAEKLVPPDYSKLEAKLKREKRKLSKRLDNAIKMIHIKKHEAEKDPLVHVPTLLEFNRYQKQRIKVAKIQEKIRNKKEYWLKTTSSKIIRDYDLVAIEDLKVKDMLRKKKGKGSGQHSKLAHIIANSNFSEFRQMLQYKADWNNKELVAIDQYYPSSQICSNCGYQYSKIKDLSIRDWDCPKCKAHHVRDINAAINILSEAKRMLKTKNNSKHIDVKAKL